MKSKIQKFFFVPVLPTVQSLIPKVFLDHLNIISHNSSEQFWKQIPVLSCTPDPTTNSEITNPNFKYLFDQLEQVLQVLFVY